jgi:hypothetical protein
LGVWSVEAATDVSGALDACRERLGLSVGAGAVRVAVAVAPVCGECGCRLHGHNSAAGTQKTFRIGKVSPFV